MSKATGKSAGSRRDFLKLASVSAPAAVAAVALGGTEAEAVETRKEGSGLQDTAHTRAYFESARF
ncbi:MAG: twin-arginine translocation pathway signal protein [Rhodobacteraceae bacterium]|nr:twin-arginine translocation pathway signal protein [Paracoccaceae bacterium]MCP5342804.1 twin-arginine translocation pathway signal protein [Paracoccaceae bacterium]